MPMMRDLAQPYTAKLETPFSDLRETWVILAQMDMGGEHGKLVMDSHRAIVEGSLTELGLLVLGRAPYLYDFND